MADPVDGPSGPVLWLDLLPAPHARADRAVPVEDSGTLRWWCAWLVTGASGAARWRRPTRSALRCDPSVLGGGGPDLLVRLTVPERDARPLHDDPAVVAATRAAAADGGRLTLCRAFVQDGVHWAGGMSAVAEETAARCPGWEGLDPWRGLATTVTLRVPGGLLSPRPLPASPGTQRRGGEPWPAGRFGTA